MERGDGEGHALVPLIGSFGLFLAVRALTVVWWSAHEPYTLPNVFGSGQFELGGQQIPYSYLGSLGATIAVGVIVAALMRFTKVGLQIRAMVDNRAAAELSGLPTRRLENITWFAGTAIAAVAAYLYFQNSSLIAGNVDLILIPSFAIAAVGGFENLGAIGIASLIFGLASNLIDRYANFPAQDVVSLAVLVVLLFVMPRGILVQRSDRYS
jgi:urea transport system permease protein